MKEPEGKVDRTVATGLRLIEGFGLGLIAVGTVIAIGHMAMQVVHTGVVAVQDILLLFIYLEIITMVGLYFSSGKLPLRYTLYIAMVAIARYIILGMKGMTGWTIVALSSAILVLALAAIAIGFGDAWFPNDNS